jgi:hypothetical protein
MPDKEIKPGYISNRSKPVNKLSKAQFYTQDSPTGKEPIKYKLVHIPAEKVEGVVKKSKLNKRNEKHLNLRAISDILPSIKLAKKNDHPCKAYGTLDDMVIMEGLRRSYAVRSVEGAQLAVWLTESVHPEDEAVIVSRADKYREPTTIDLSLTIKEFLSETDETYTVRELASLFDVSRGTAQNAKDVMKLPEAYFNKYPSLNDASLTLAIKFSKYIESLSDDEINDLLESLPDVTAIDDDGAKAGVKKLEDKIKSIMATVKTTDNKAVVKDNPFSKIKLKKGVITSMSDKGVLSIKLPASIDEDTMNNIAKLLSQ